MLNWKDFLEIVEELNPFTSHDSAVGKVMVSFQNRYLEPLDGVRYKFLVDGKPNEGTTTTNHSDIVLSPKSIEPIRIYVWSEKHKQYKELKSVVPKIGAKVLERKILTNFKTSGKTARHHPNDTNRDAPRPTTPTPGPAPGVSPKGDQGIHIQPGRNEKNEPDNKVKRPVPGEVTFEQLRKIYPIVGGQPADDYLKSVAKELNNDLSKYKLDTPIRLAHFFGQIRQEAGSRLMATEEGFNYKPQGLIGTFSGYYSSKRSEAEEDGRIEGLIDKSFDVLDKKTKKKITKIKKVKVVTQQAKQETIANKVYANRIGNGDIASGDGWNFRGRGFKQLTGRSNYKDFQEKYKNYWSGSVDVLAKPDLVSEFPLSLRSAIYFWVENKCWAKADDGVNDAAIDAVTKIVNSGEISKHNSGAYSEGEDPVIKRRSYTKLAYAAFT